MEQGISGLLLRMVDSSIYIVGILFWTVLLLVTLRLRKISEEILFVVSRFNMYKLNIGVVYRNSAEGQ